MKMSQGQGLFIPAWSHAAEDTAALLSRLDLGFSNFSPTDNYGIHPSEEPILRPNSEDKGPLVFSSPG